ncbi:MAG: IPT/TIG domain-containing protein [Deltaproteobacteria bacterium]|nr:IPT/TIG domain-containing protein [Deltaproteobacteria bacterium]
MRRSSRFLVGFLVLGLAVGCGGGVEEPTPAEDAGADSTPPKRGPVVFVSEPVVGARVGVAYRYEAKARQEGAPAGETPSFAVEKGPAGLVIEPASGVVTWTPKATDAGKQSVVLTATATDGQSARQEYTIGVDVPVGSGVMPAAGSSAGGEKVVIKGANFTAGMAVRFAGVNATTTFVDDGTLEAVTPAHVAGTTVVELVSAGEVADTLRPGFTFVPRIESLEASTVSVGGTVSLTAVGFDPTDLTADVLSLASRSTTARRMPAAGAADGKLSFSTSIAGGEARPTTGPATLLVNGVRSNCVALKVSDATAPAALSVTGVKAASGGGLTLEGSGFGGLTPYDGVAGFDLAAPSALYVMFAGAGRPAKVNSISTDGSSIDVTPPTDAVTGPVRLFAPGRLPATGCVIAEFTGTTAALGVTGFTPDGGTAGSAVVISGSGFPPDSTAVTVTIGGTAAKILSAEPTRLVVAVPASVAIGPREILVGVGGKTVSAGALAVTGRTTVLAGGAAAPAPTGDGGSALAARVNPGFLAVDESGNYLVSDGRTVRLVNGGTAATSAYGKTVAPGVIQTVVDMSKIAGAPRSPVGALAIHPATQDLYFTVGSRVFRALRTDGTVSPFAGSGADGFSGDGGPRLGASFSASLTDLRFTAAASRKGALLVIADNGNGWVRVINTTSTAITLWGVTVGADQVAGVEKTGTANPMGATLDSQDNLFVTRFGSVLRIGTDRPTRPTGSDPTYVPFTVVAGATGVETLGVGCPATSIGLGTNNGIAYDTARDSYYLGSRNGLVRRVRKATSGTEDCIDIVAGKRAPGAAVADIGYSGDGGSALSASIGLFARPFVDRDGSVLLVGDGRVRKVVFATDSARTPGDIKTIIGSGPNVVPDGSPGKDLTSIDALAGVVVDATRARYLYASAGRIFGHSRSDNTVVGVAGTGIRGNFSEGAVATKTSIGVPRGMALAGAEVLLLEAVLPRISATDLGTGTFRVVTGDGLAATPAERIATAPLASARVSFGTGAAKVVVASSGAVFFTDEERVRVLNPTTAPITVFGRTVAPNTVDLVDGAFGSGLAGIALDKLGNLWVSSLGDRLVVKRSSDSVVEVMVAAEPEPTGFPLAGTLETIRLNDPTDLAFTSAGDLMIATSGGRALVVVEADSMGRIGPKSRAAAILGNGAPGTVDSGLPGTAASGAPAGVAMDGKRVLAIVEGQLVAVDP